jgi:hypothetical protein
LLATGGSCWQLFMVCRKIMADDLHVSNSSVTIEKNPRPKKSHVGSSKKKWHAEFGLASNREVNVFHSTVPDWTRARKASPLAEIRCTSIQDYWGRSFTKKHPRLSTYTPSPWRVPSSSILPRTWTCKCCSTTRCIRELLSEMESSATLEWQGRSSSLSWNRLLNHDNFIKSLQ